MKFMTIAVALAVTGVYAQSAQARGHQHRHRVSHDATSHVVSQHYSSRGRHYSSRARNYAPENNYGDTYSTAYSAPLTDAGQFGRRPSAWCGWQMRQLVSADPGPAYNLARNWAHWGHAGPPGVGAVVVWPHHVGKIVGQENGMWIIESGNDGHRVRTRPRSIASAIAIRWG